MNKLVVIAGAQYGSEAKGHVTAQTLQGWIGVDSRHVLNLNLINVRVAGPNAGHTVVDANDNHIALRQIPVGAAVSDDIILYIAPGSEVDLSVVVSEITKLRNHGHPVSNLYISGEATLLEESHIREEQANDLTGKLGSTAKGIGAARADRIWRRAKRVMDDRHTVDILEDLGVKIVNDNLKFWEDHYTRRHAVAVIEGTQGYGLGLHAGNYPYCTSSDTRAIDFIAMSGCPTPFTSYIEVVLVARMFPIRVAGNSGDIKGETTWDDLGLEEERTTVTQKVRRVGEWDMDLVKDASEANGGSFVPVTEEELAAGYANYVVLTMVDQKWPLLSGLSGTFSGVENEILGTEGVDPQMIAQWIELRKFIKEVGEHGVLIKGLTTSPSTIITGV